jgi:hypothetical protein
MKKMPKFAKMEYTTSTNNLMNYELLNSNSNNYGTLPKTPTPTSFPALMENGILVKYETLNFSSDLIEEKIPEE